MSQTRKKKAKSSTPSIPKVIYAQVSPKSIGGQSLFEIGSVATSENVVNYSSEKQVTIKAVEELRNAGFNILQITDRTINISGSASKYKRAFGTDIVARELPSMKSGTQEEPVTFLDTIENDVIGLIETKNGKMADYIEGVAIETAYYPLAANYLPSVEDYWHLNVPADVSAACNADRAHRLGYTGKNVRVAMVDTGFFRHSFYTKRGYRVNPTILGPGTSNPLRDNHGHGTGEAANIFATAPDCQLTPIKMNFTNATGSFNTAVAARPHIITCSWGSHRPTALTAADQVLGASVAFAVSRGIVVVFSAGNGQFGFPGQHPDVISAGGVYIDERMNLAASNYSSGFDSSIFPGRRVPDVCGLVGQQPRAQYIMLPVQPGCLLDQNLAGGNFPNGDETSQRDGWAAFSGTSAAAPQLAGVAAIIKQACGRLTPHQIRSIMRSTAIDVTTGSSSTGTTSVVGPDNSTGNGLINAYRATVFARLRCILSRTTSEEPERVVRGISNYGGTILQSSTEVQEQEYSTITQDDADEVMAMIEEGQFDVDDLSI